jgi:hypothetical protein
MWLLQVLKIPVVDRATLSVAHLFPGATINVMGLRHPPVFEDMAIGAASLQRLSRL